MQLAGDEMRSVLVGLALLIMAIFAPLVDTAEGRSIHSVANFDITTNSFSNSSDWTITAKKGYSTDAAEFTSGMVADNHLTFDHNRTLNTQSATLWSTTNSTNDHGSATGHPDNYVAVSSGPEIIVGGFQTTGMETYDIQSIKLVLVFNIPDPLYSDSVRASIEVGGMNALIKEFSHTQTGLFYMTSPYWNKDISDEEYSWQDIASANVKVDYASQGGTDDSQVRLDAVGFEVVFRSPWFGIETAVAEREITSDWPIIEVNLSAGLHDDISQSPCGLESSSASAGTWTSEEIERPHSQSWGRLSIFSDGNNTWKVATSSDATTWSSFVTQGVDDLLPDSKFLMLQGSIFDGCVSAVRVDINDPSLVFSWQIGESLEGINSSTSWLEVRIDGVQVFSADLISLSSSSEIVPLGKFLPKDSDSMTLSYGIVFSWESDGQPATTVVQVDSMQITGGYSLEWDEDPECTPIGDVELLEDGVGSLVPILNSCSDDRTASADLILSVTSDRSDIVIVDTVGDQIRVNQITDQSGDTIVTATITDEAGNTWSQSYVARVAPLNDAPEFTELPQSTIIASLGETYSLPLAFADPDSTTLSVDTSYSWATWNQSTSSVDLNPIMVGIYDLQIIVSDGDLNVTRNINVEVKSTADLVVDQVTYAGNISSGSMVDIEVHVRNSGLSDAYFVTVECRADGDLLKIVTLAEVKSGVIETAICPWLVQLEDDVALIDVVIDSGDDIFESDETNNDYSKSKSIEVISTTTPQNIAESTEISQNMVWAGTIGAVLLLIGLFIMFGPAPIRKIE